MIRVLHIVNSMDLGGLETFIMNVYRNIDRKKIQFDFLVHQIDEGVYDQEIRNLGGKIYRVLARNHGIIANRKSLNDFFASNHGYAAVHLHSSSLSYLEPIKYAKKYNIPIRIVHAHSTKEGGSKLHTYIHKVNKILVNQIATDYLSCSDLATDWMFRKSITKSERYQIINNGIDVEKFHYKLKTRESKRKELNIEGKFVIGHIGRLSYPKNHEFLLELFAEYIKKDPKTILMLVGDGEMRQEIEDKIKLLNIQKSVLMLGAREDTSELLQAMDLFIFPSRYEGLPVTLVEAQATGLSCLISSNVTRQVEITENCQYLSINDGVKIWTEAIEKEKLQNKKRYNQIDEILRAKFDVDSVARILSKIYLVGDN